MKAVDAMGKNVVQLCCFHAAAVAFCRGRNLQTKQNAHMLVGLPSALVVPPVALFSGHTA